MLGLSVNISHESFPSRLAVTKRGLDFASREQAEKHFPDSFTVDLIFGQGRVDCFDFEKLISELEKLSFYFQLSLSILTLSGHLA